MIYHIDFCRKVFLKFISVFTDNEDIRVKVQSFYEKSDEYINLYHKLKGDDILSYESEYSF